MGDQGSPGQTRVQQPLNLPSEEAREEGEILPVGENLKTTPSKEFQEQVANTQAAGNEVISDPVDTEEGLQMVKEDLQDDVEEGIRGQEEEKITQDEEVQLVEEEEKGHGAGEVAQKQGVRKKLSKLMVSTAARTKMRTANALVSPRKRAAARISSRYGDNSKQQESKGPSNPSSDQLKL
ncbi:hypothetical protein Bca52824_061119 [Brassica carinata]|uniref:Uncharacterized protein n=1 Tax=Brassica carinata TaxID=52824 RepID=A0A8X7UHE0_BRACI|nr:hypothetical protein Bca52824_061119 [Brassica carinata]